MSTSIISRTAFAVGLLTSTVSAAFNANSKNNVAVYWGGAPSPGNRPLAELCANPSVDIVNIGFINGFPTEVGQYPKSNHGNACYAETYTDPTTGQPSGLYTTCNGVEAAIKQCQALGKKVMLSLGGAEPPNYYLKNKAVAEWFAEFLIGAYGPVTKEWTDAGSPRPFGSAVLDGFDLDLEADPKRMPGGNSDLIFANYEFFGNYVKAHAPQMLLSGAPQCIVPDARLYPVLTKVPFDMLFVQFYNTEDCSARLGLTDLNKGSTGFSFDTWADWLVKNAAQGDKVKLYLGLPAGPSAVGANYRHHYLQPREANLLIQKYKSRASFGGVMVWEAMVSTNNQNFCKSYDYWVKKSLENTFGRDYTTSACATSSSVLPSSTKVSSTKISSSTLVSSTKVSSSSIVSSTKISSSTLVSSTKVSSSSVISSTKVSSSSIASSTKISSSSVVSSTKVSSSYIVSSTKISSSSIVSSTKVSSSKLSSSTPVSSKASSSAYIVSPTPKASSTMYPASSSFSSSAYYVSSSAAPSSSSVYIDTSVSAYSSQYSVVKSSSAEIVPVSKDSYPTVSAPEEYPESTPYLSAPQSTPHVSAAESSYYDEFPAYSASSSVYYYSESIPEAASSTPCTTSSQYYVAETSTPYLSAAESSYYNIEVPASSVYEVYPVETPDASSKGEIYSTGKGYDSIPTATKGVEYPSKPSDATTTVVTTTYVDVCPTGLTTKTTTVVKTVCNSCAKPTQYPEDVPEGWTTSVYVSKTLTVTITKPAHPTTDVPAYPSSVPEGHGAEYSAIPQPSSPSSNKPEVPVYKEEYPEQPAQPQYPTAAVSSKAQQYPAQSGVPEYPKKPVEDITSAYVQHTLSKVAVPVYTPAPYPSAPAPAPYVPAPANNGTTAYVPLPTGTGKPTKPSSYSPAEFEGAASRFGVGLTAMVGVVAAFFVL